MLSYTTILWIRQRELKLKTTMKFRMNQPTGGATPQQLKLAHSRNFHETVNQPNKFNKIVTCYNADEKPLGNIALHIKGKSKAMPGFAATLPRRSRERGAKAHLRMQRPIIKPSSKTESYPQECSTGNQKASK